MWVNNKLFQLVLDDNKEGIVREINLRASFAGAEATMSALKTQNAKNDITIDWMRHRINALEKERAVLLNKVGGVIIPVPEIVPSRPGTMTNLDLDMNSMPSFEDVGESEAKRLGILHDEAGQLSYKA